ncbi:DUF559 domain-containing protein [Saccharicrinis sp. FJH62]|uniref:DUF559 domain-containing protein n=1 Tax=Saccharicrinis sp. FJH62 TaxID=3344657 RepID=UPI0035D419CB
MITNRPKYLSDNIDFYNSFPQGFNLDIDYKTLPPLLNFDFHTLNGILPLTKPRFEFIGENSTVDGKRGTTIEVNPSPIEYEYYKSIGVTEFQAISIIFNFYAFNKVGENEILGKPYSVSLIPMEKNGKIDTWNIDLLKTFDLRELCQRGGHVFTDFNPIKGWYSGMAMHYSLFSKMPSTTHSDSIGFQWGMYFLSPIFDKKDVIMAENHTYSRPINAKYRKYKTNLYYKTFPDTRPRRIWGCDSPIELFLLQGFHIRGLSPEIQMSIYKTGEIIPNYFKMQEDEIWLGEEKLITAADFFFSDNKLAIFCDGSEFHDEAKDKIIDSKLADLGIKSMRFSGKEITEQIESVLDKIEKELKNGSS